MSLSLYMDEHVDRAITDALRDLNIDVLTVQDEHREGLHDIEVLRRARELNRVVFTYDDDFLRVAANFIENAEEFAGLLYLKSGSLPIRQAIDELYLIAGVYEPEEIVNDIVYLPLK